MPYFGEQTESPAAQYVDVCGLMDLRYINFTNYNMPNSWQMFAMAG